MSPKPRRWSIFAAALLVLALGLVVIYTSRPAFSSPLALVVVAAIGLAALLMQLRLRKDLHSAIHAPLWLNVLGLCLAIAAVFADHLHLSANLMIIAALGAVICFGSQWDGRPPRSPQKEELAGKVQFDDYVVAARGALCAYRLNSTATVVSTVAGSPFTR